MTNPMHEWDTFFLIVRDCFSRLESLVAMAIHSAIAETQKNQCSTSWQWLALGQKSWKSVVCCTKTALRQSDLILVLLLLLLLVAEKSIASESVQQEQVKPPARAQGCPSCFGFFHQPLGWMVDKNLSKMAMYKTKVKLGKMLQSQRAKPRPVPKAMFPKTNKKITFHMHGTISE